MQTFIHVAIKYASGAIIVPLSFGMVQAWPWWEKAGTGAKILTAPFILPAVGFLWLVSAWWNEL
jgi:hypothetical protein